VIGLISILAGLLLGPVGRALKRARAMQWAEDASRLLDSTVEQLRTHFQGQTDFPLVTVEMLEAREILDPSRVRFLKDRRVTYQPFSGDDPDDKIVILVLIEPGFLTDAGTLVATKARITKPPE